VTKSRHDRLLAALIAKLPVEKTQWMRDDRIAWMWMMALAFDVVYGPCGGISIMAEEQAAANAKRDAGAASLPAAAPNDPSPAGRAARRFYVDRDGFAMADGRPITMDELPPNETLWDERPGIDSGDVAAILWRGIGTTRRSLPRGVALKPALDAA
jgi:hypothetical protein